MKFSAMNSEAHNSTRPKSQRFSKIPSTLSATSAESDQTAQQFGILMHQDTIKMDQKQADVSKTNCNAALLKNTGGKCVKSMQTDKQKSLQCLSYNCLPASAKEEGGDKNKNIKDVRRVGNMHMGKVQLKMRNNAMKMDRYIYCCKLVDDIYKCIQELKEVGYGHSKINEWFLQYCTGPINHLRGVFMDNLTPEAPADRAKHEYTRRPQVVKERLKFRVSKLGIFLFVSTEDLLQMFGFWERLLIDKNQFKTKEVEQSISEKMIFALGNQLDSTELIFNRNCPSEIAQFASQLKTHEEKYGFYNRLNTATKLHFSDLIHVQQTLQRKEQQLQEWNRRRLKGQVCLVAETVY